MGEEGGEGRRGREREREGREGTDGEGARKSLTLLRAHDALQWGEEGREREGVLK